MEHQDRQIAGESMRNFLDEHDIRRRQHELSPVQGNEPSKDERFFEFVLSHKEGIKRVVCDSQEFKDSPVCSGGRSTML